jgi:hypothetical protein
MNSLVKQAISWWHKIHSHSWYPYSNICCIRQGTIETWICDSIVDTSMLSLMNYHVMTRLPIPLTGPSAVHTSTAVWGSQIRVQWTLGHRTFDHPAPALIGLSFHVFREICFVGRGKNSCNKRLILFSNLSLLQCLWHLHHHFQYQESQALLPSTMPLLNLQRNELFVWASDIANRPTSTHQWHLGQPRPMWHRSNLIKWQKAQHI